MRFILLLIVLCSVLGLFQLFSLGDFGVAPVEACVGLLFVYAFYHGVWLGRPFRVPRRIEVVVMCLLLLSFVFSSIGPLLWGQTGHLSQGLKTLAHFVFLWMGAFLIVVLPITSKDWIVAFRFHFVISFIVVVFAAYQLPARTFDWPLGWIEITNDSFKKLEKETNEVKQLALRFADFYRATSIFSEPSALAGYSAVSLMMMLVPVFRRSKAIIKSNAFLVLSIIFTTIALFLSFSMTGLALVIGIILMCVALYPKTAMKRVVSFFAAAVLLLVVADFVIEENFNISVLTLFSTRVSGLVSGQATSEGSDIIGESVGQRTSDYYVSGKVFEESPVIGVGPGNFGKVDIAKRTQTVYPSTVYGSVLGEMGIIGIIIFVGFLLLLFARSFAMERWWTKYRRGEDSDLDRLVPLLPFRIVIAFLGGFSGSNLISAIFWIDIAIVMSTLSLARRAMGTEVLQDVFVVQRSWRDRIIDGVTATRTRPDSNSGGIGV